MNELPPCEICGRTLHTSVAHPAGAAIVRQLVEALEALAMTWHRQHNPVDDYPTCHREICKNADAALTAARAWLEEEAR